MPTISDVKTVIQDLIRIGNAKTGRNDRSLTYVMTALMNGYGRDLSGNGGGKFYLGHICLAEDADQMEVIHELGTTDILLAAVWAERDDVLPSNGNTMNYTYAKFWAKTSMPTLRGGTGFSPGYTWNSTNNEYTNPTSPISAAYESITVVDENAIILPRANSGSLTLYQAGVLYTALVVPVQ